MRATTIRRITLTAAHWPTGTTWALARGLRQAAVPDPSSPGPVRGFEQEAAFHLGARHAVSFGSAPAALTGLLAALALPAGADLALPALAAPWVLQTVRDAGLTPRLLDVREDTLHLDPAAIPAGVAAVLVQHTAGVPADLDALGTACAERGVPLIEDFGPAVGARWKSRPVGAIGRAGVARLDDSRAVSAFGGALVCTEADDLDARLRAAPPGRPTGRGIATRIAAGHLRILRSWPRAAAFVPAAGARGAGRAERWLLGSAEARATALHPAQAEAGRNGLFALQGYLDGVREAAATLRYGLPAGAWRQAVPDGALPVWSRLLVRCEDPAGCARAAARAGVEVEPAPLVDLSDGACPEAARAARECAALPCHPRLSGEDLARVLEVVAGWVR
jgi:hypothetical protein